MSILIFTFYIINCIYLIIFHTTPSVILVTEVLEQPGSESSDNTVVVICECCPANIYKQRTLLAVVDDTPSRVGLDHMTFQCFALRKASSQKCLFNLRQLH